MRCTYFAHHMYDGVNTVCPSCKHQQPSRLARLWLVVQAFVAAAVREVMA